MEPLRDRIVTLASMLPPPSAGEAYAHAAQTPEGRLALERYAQIVHRLRQETAKTGAGVMIAVTDRAVSLAQSRLALEGVASRPLASGGQEVQFGPGIAGGDWLRWILSLKDWVDRKDAHPIVRPATSQPDPLPERARVALAGDWGTGLYGAPKIAATIRGMAAADRFDLLLHLGDVYYAGTKEEVQERFLALWPIEAGTVSRALNSNHEMYSGGAGYFNLTLPAFGQPGSYFALRNDHWLLVGLDTAYVDHDIDNEQLAWLNRIVATAQSDPLARRRVVLFSHHQPFSRLDAQGPKLQQALQHLLATRAITAWYWGHEHECVIYDPHPAWGLLGRCLGNGGLPSVRRSEPRDAPVDARNTGGNAARCTWRRLSATADSPGCIILDGPNLDMKQAADQERFGPHGFMTLEFEGSRMTERAFLSNGTELFSNTIP